jgi:DNA gyrase subunit B
MEVEDYGRGIPVDYNNNEKRFNWELVYCELYAGGKYNNNEGENYEYSLGLNGLGACATQYASAWFEVTVMRDGYKYGLQFEKGNNVGGLKKEKTRFLRTGTIQRWLPDTEVFTDIKIPLEYFRLTLKRQAVVNAGVTFVFDDEVTDTHETYHYPEGITGYLAELDEEKGLTAPFALSGEGEGRDRKDRSDYRVRVEIAFCFNNENPALEYFHNSSYLEYGGSPDKAVRSAFVSIFDKLCKERGKYKTNESKLTFVDIQESLILVSNSFSTMTSYENQTKKAINNKFIQEFLTDLLRTNLEVWAIERFADADKALDQVLVNKRSRESAESARLNIRKKLSGGLDMTNRVKKFVDCRTKDVSRRELYIVEGDSALGSTKLGRDAEFQAIMPIRGKILNCLKADLPTIFKSDIITDLLKVLGCGVEISGKHKNIASFDLSALRWNKVIICTDADVDGFQIRTLVLAMFYRLTPTLIREGKIFIAESPLFEITKRKGREVETYFAYSEAERVEILRKLDPSKCKVQRSKGLGENQPEMMWQTTMNPETRRMIRIRPDDPEKMARTFDVLLGDDLPGRKRHIAEEGHLYMEMLDVN